jgi:DNA polymerase (family 10)
VPVHNADIAAVFDEIADLLEIQGGNPFRVRAYRNAARTVGDLTRDLFVLVEKDEPLPKLPGVGPDLEGKIREICASGSCALQQELHRKLPPAITELLKIPGLGPKRVKALHDRLHVRTLDELKRAAAGGRIRDIAGFGEKTEQHIIEALEARAPDAPRFKWATASQYGAALVSHLARVPGVKSVVIAGSFRRARDTVGDLDLLVTGGAAGTVMDAFCGYDEVREVTSHGDTRSSVVLKCGLQVDLRLVAPESYGAALHYFTGSKAHNIAVRRLGQERGLKINEYGVFEGAKRIAGETELSVYRSVGLPYIPPELREDRGEIEAARTGRLPELVERADLRGDLHVHTSASDGRASLADMVAAARAAGLSYIAITDHSRRLAVARGLDPRRVAKQIDEIDRLNATLRGFAILKGIEVDILPDGNLDLPDSVLERLDLVVGAVHDTFNLPRKRQTERLLRAMDHRCFSVLAHPSGRLIGERAACDFDMLAVVRAAKQRGCAVELNAQPERMDLQDIHCQMAREEGVPVSIASDAHTVHDFAHLDQGIAQARRGWLTAADVVNARPLAALRRLLARTMR